MRPTMQGRATVAETTGHGDAVRAQAGAAEVLVVDDEPVTARGYARALSAAGYKVNVAHDGREAAAMAKAHSYDVIISDIAMPDMDGLALLRDDPRERPGRAHDLHDRQPGPGERGDRHRVRRVPLPGEADLARCDAGVGRPRGARAQPRPGPPRGDAGPRAGRQADRRPGGAGGAVLVGRRQAVGRGAADRLLVGAAHLRLRDAAPHRRADAAQPARLLRRRRAAGQGRRAGADHPRSTWRGSCARRPRRRCCS